MDNHPAPPPITNLTPVFIGNLIESGLLGILTIQVVVFLQRPVSGWDKLVCVGLWCMTLLHLVSAVQFAYESIFVYKGDLTGVPTPWNYSLAAVLDLFISNLTQIFYAVRLWKLFKKTYYRNALFIFLGLLIGLGLSLDACESLISPVMHETLQDTIRLDVPYKLSKVSEIYLLLTVDFKWAVMLAFTLASVIDCILSASLIIMLYNSNQRLDWTDSQLNVILAYAVNSGALASLFSITCPLTYIILPESFIFLSLRYILVPLYFNSLLAMLNAQHYL
ncbi:hypothetical protein AAF712_010361 [Marasmius tenuissimus]|uniref:DUF6534 domain-containing protein n=1 Tax=Marasmius tenuissimus TaxID=585030 RepID=A0ABR2ZP89_9AGAR